MKEKKENKWENSRFNKKIRISDKQLEYLRSIKGEYTLAGKLDELINKHKNGTTKKPLS